MVPVSINRNHPYTASLVCHFCAGQSYSQPVFYYQRLFSVLGPEQGENRETNGFRRYPVNQSPFRIERVCRCICLYNKLQIWNLGCSYDLGRKLERASAGMAGLDADGFSFGNDYGSVYIREMDEVYLDGNSTCRLLDTAKRLYGLPLRDLPFFICFASPVFIYHSVVYSGTKHYGNRPCSIRFIQGKKTPTGDVGLKAVISP